MLVMRRCVFNIHVKGQWRRFYLALQSQRGNQLGQGMWESGKSPFARHFIRRLQKKKRGVLVINLPLRYRRSLAFDTLGQTRIP